MADLPTSSELPVEHLAACFNNVTNSYKFYWFLSILESVRTSQTRIIPINDLLAQMVANVWYPSNYFRLSFGKQDRLSQIALEIKAENGLPIEAKRENVAEIISNHLSRNSDLANEIKSLGRFVPYRFLRPFFNQKLKGKPDWKINRLITEMADKSFHHGTETCLYRFISNPEYSIEIQIDWFDYFQKHIQILTGFCLWHLLNYVQKNNPNAPNIAGKLFKPEKRELKLARSFWRFVFDQVGPIRCIYSDYAIQKDNFSLDHFLPWSFVTHDLLWNIIPAPKNVNSAKSDQLPDPKLYFDLFAKLQYQAVQAIATRDKAKLLEDYTLLFKMDTISQIKLLPFERFRETLHDTVMPQLQIAKNMGFATNWSYTKS